MKRICMIIMAFVIMTIGSAAAYNPYAPNPFDTMERNSWEYTSLCTLSKDGLTGADMSKFSPTYSLTRYEMAQMVETAMRNRSRATAAQKETIDKLAEVFADDLKYAGTSTVAAPTEEGVPFDWQKGGTAK